MVRVSPSFEEGQPLDRQWLDIQDGTGRIYIGVDYTRNESSEIGDVEHTVFAEPSIGCPTDKVWRRGATQQIYLLKTIGSTEDSSSPAVPRGLRFPIDSPFIAPLILASHSSKGSYLFLPNITGGHLFYPLQQKQYFSTNASRFYSAEILCALDHLHSLDIAYDGLKPWNILLHSSGHIAIGDPNLSVSEQQDTRAAAGPTRYSASEALLGRGHSKLSNWWTLGIFLYEMLTGLPPFYDESADETRRKILSDSEPLQLPDSLAFSAKDILTRLLDREPERRLGEGEPSRSGPSILQRYRLDKLARREYDTFSTSQHRNSLQGIPPPAKNPRC